MHKRRYCGNVIYRKEVYKVYWHPETKHVLVDKEGGSVINFNYENARADFAHEAAEKAKQMLVSAYGDDSSTY
jgi:hypothetical protein